MIHLNIAGLWLYNASLETENTDWFLIADNFSL